MYIIYFTHFKPVLFSIRKTYEIVFLLKLFVKFIKKLLKCSFKLISQCSINKI